MDIVKLVHDMDESEFTAGVQELVDATAPRLFAVVAELGDREDAYVAAWGLEIDDRTVLVVTGDRPTFMLCDSPEQAHRRLSRVAPARLVHPHPHDCTAAAPLHAATSPQ